MYITAIHRPWRKLRGGICRHKTFWMQIFARTTFLLLRCCCSIHVKLCVLATYSARNWVQKSWLRQQYTAVSPISGSPTCDTEKNPRKTERGEFITPLRPTSRRSNYVGRLLCNFLPELCCASMLVPRLKVSMNSKNHIHFFSLKW